MNNQKKKVKFSLTKFTKKGSFRFTGYGEIDNENLYTYNKVYEDCIRYWHQMINFENEYRGSFSLFETIEITNDKNQLVEIEVENDYTLWYRVLD